MKIRALANGDVREAGDEEARQLIDAGIYEAADAKKPEKSTKVEPLTTDDIPTQPKKPAKK